MSNKILFLSLILQSALSSNTFCLLEDKMNGQCSVCMASIPQPTFTCTFPTRPVENCIIYSHYEECFICIFGYELIDGKCKKIDDSNKCIYPVGKECRMCRKKVLLYDDGTCSDKFTCSDEHVDYCRSLGKGQEAPLICEEGYLIRDPFNTCEKAPESLKNCWYSYDMKDCTECKINYYLENGACIKSPHYYFDLDWMRTEQPRERVL